MVTISEGKIIDFILNSQQGELIQKEGRQTQKLKIDDKTYRYDKNKPVSKVLNTKLKEVARSDGYRKHSLLMKGANCLKLTRGRPLQDYFDVDYCKYGMNYRKRTRLWSNIETWEPRPSCKGDCGKIENGKHWETAQRLPSGKKSDWGEGYIKHKQDELYKVPSNLVSEIFVCLF